MYSYYKLHLLKASQRYHPRKKGINSRQILPAAKNAQSYSVWLFCTRNAKKTLIWLSKLLNFNYIFAIQYRNNDGYHFYSSLPFQRNIFSNETIQNSRIKSARHLSGCLAYTTCNTSTF